MDRNKTIITSVTIISIASVIAFYGYIFANRFKDKDITIYDSYTFCIRSVMDKSRDNGKPCSAQEAEKICHKFNK